jgi:hypothetical protein
MVSNREVDGVKVSVDLEASDSLAVRLNGMRVEGSGQPEPSRLQEQTRKIVDEVTYLDGQLAMIEVDGVSNAVQIRTKKPELPKYVEVILRGGNVITVEAKAAPVHVSQENLEKLTETLVRLVK